ncbi:unnamed protein product [Trichobilharzia szidati]|nr:unnamed protein product [Trichobilharzia szidati]
MPDTELLQVDSNNTVPDVLVPETLIYQGAEARVYRTKLFRSTYTFPCIVKERFVKRYRHSTLDSTLSMQRMRAEVRQLLRCREAGIDVPPILLVDIRRRRIWLGEIGPDAVTLQDWFKTFSTRAIETDISAGDLQKETVSQLRDLTAALGRLLAQLHSNHIIHGDLTLANILIQQKDVNGKQISFRVVPIDFGLSSASSGLTSQRLAEDKAVDLYVFERALTCGLDHKALLKAFPDHPDLNTPDGVMNLIMDAYRENYAVQQLNEESEPPQQQERVKCKSSVNKKSGDNLNPKKAEVKEVLSRLEEVRQRGRKRLMVG